MSDLHLVLLYLRQFRNDIVAETDFTNKVTIFLQPWIAQKPGKWTWNRRRVMLRKVVLWCGTDTMKCAAICPKHCRSLFSLALLLACSPLFSTFFTDFAVLNLSDKTERWKITETRPKKVENYSKEKLLKTSISSSLESRPVLNKRIPLIEAYSKSSSVSFISQVVSWNRGHK